MYKVEIFSDQFVYKSMAMVDEYTTTIEQDFLTYDSNTIQTPLIECEKGDLVHITDQDNNYVADGIIGDVQPSDKAQEITIRPLNALFDTEVFYTAVTDCITWLATNIDSAFMSNTDTLQNRPITLTYTASAEALPLTGFNLHETVNILSVMISAMKTYGVVVASRLDLPNKRFTVDIYQQTATKVLEASLDNVLQKSVTIGDNYGSTNKAVIRKIRVVDDVTTVLGQTEFYLHTDGTINATDGNRIVPVFWEIESLELDDDMTESEWQAAALSRAKEILTPAKYDNEIVLQYDRDDLLARPADMLIGTATTIYLDGNTYASILTGKRIEGQKITLIFGVTRTELTKQLSIKQRESVTYQNTVSAINKIVEKRISSGGGSSVDPSTTLPLMDGTAAVGTEQTYARGDHVHPTDTSRVAKSGDTMEGKLKTAWGNSWGHFVMNGSGQADSSNVPDLVNEMRFSSGAMGSTYITTAYTHSNGITIKTGWYNFIYVPHRSGGNVGQADGDNQDYGQLILIGMTIYRGQEYIISISGGSVVDIKRTVSQWTTFKTDNLAVSSSVTSLSLAGYNYAEILVEVGQVHGSQIYGGTSAVLVKDSNHPTFINYATGGTTVPFVFYAFQHGDVLDIRNVAGVNSTCRYRISLR